MVLCTVYMMVKVVDSDSLTPAAMHLIGRSVGYSEMRHDIHVNQSR